MDFNQQAQARVGSIPGIYVGDHFLKKGYLAAVGLHRRPDSGIEYSKVDGVMNGTALSWAFRSRNWRGGSTSVYKGSLESREEAPSLVNPANVAMVKSFTTGSPIHLMRQSFGSRDGNPFMYMGLYKIIGYEARGLLVGSHGEAFMQPHPNPTPNFFLTRIPGQVVEPTIQLR